MRILFLTFYFEPDLCAGSFRAKELVKSLSARLSADDTLHVLTTMPNRYHSFRTPADPLEKRGNVIIERVHMPPHKSGMIDQAQAFLYYAAGVFMRVRRVPFDMVFATSSRLMTAVLGAVLSKARKKRLYIDIRDIFTDTLSDMFGPTPRRWILPILSRLERMTIRQADRINLVSPGFVNYFNLMRSDLDYRTFTNGIDEIFLNSGYEKANGDGSVNTILYAGNMGSGQGLDRIIPEAAAKLESRWQFRIIGDGGTRRRLQDRIDAIGVGNVHIMDPVDQSRLIDYYRSADVLFLHLNDYPAFKKVLPSKIFEYAATGKPILAGVDGYSRDFIQSHIPNSAVFNPCDADGLVRGLERLEMKTKRPDEFISRFRRSAVSRRMADDVLELASMQPHKTNAPL